MIVHRIDPPLYVETYLGKAQAIFMLVDSAESWKFIVVQEDTGELFGWENHKIRMRQNLSDDRFFVTAIELSKAEQKALAPHLNRRNEHLKKVLG